MAAKSLFCCRIVDISSYNAAPVKDLDVCYSEFRSCAVAKVPVVRIFGSTPTGQKTCLHVHGVFPYIFVPSPVTNPSPSYLQQLASSIDQALQLSLGGNGLKSDQHHVFKISVVKGTPMYGYHARRELFLKIYLYNPAMIKRLSELLVARVVMGTVLQPHEAHIPFVLQMMIDYNLYGMNFIHLSSVKFRSAREGVTPDRRSRSRSLSSSLLSPISPPTSLAPTPSQQVWDVDSLPPPMLVCVPRVSECELEVDALAVDIMNREQTSVGRGGQFMKAKCSVGEGFPGLAAVWEEERERRKYLGLHDSLTPPPSPDRERSSTELPELTAAFASIIEERLGQSELSQSLSLHDSLSESASCDHRPIRSEGSVARGGAEPVVDEEAIQQSLELSQRLRIDSLRKSTDEELLDLMLELATTPVGTATQQSSQSLYHHTQTVASSLCGRIARPPSSLSRLSKPGDTSLLHSQPVPNTSMTGFKTGFTSSGLSKPDDCSIVHSQPAPNTSMTGFTSSKPVSSNTSDSKPNSLTTQTLQTTKGDQDAAVLETSWGDVDRFLVAGENLLNWSGSEANSSNRSCQVITEHVGSSKPSQTGSEPVNKPVERGSPSRNEPSLHSASKSPVFSDMDLFDTDFSSSSPVFLSPSPPAHRHDAALVNSKEILRSEEDIRDPSVMLNSSSVVIGNRDKRSSSEVEENPELMSDFDIPCAQPVSSFQGSAHSGDGVSGPIQDVLKTDGDNDKGTLVPKGVASTVAVQLEYEMPEISLSQFESFQSLTTEILGTPSKMAATGTTTPQKKQGVKDGNDGVNKEKEGSRKGTEKFKESSFKVSSSLVTSEGYDPLLESSFVATGNTIAAGFSTGNPPKESSTPFIENTMMRREGDVENTMMMRRERDVAGELSLLESGKLRSERGREGEEEGTSVCLSSSQRRAILRELNCAVGESGDLSGEEGGSEQEEEEEEEEWLSGELSTQPLTIPESPQGSQPDSPIHGLDRSTTNTEDRIGQLDGPPDDPKKMSDKITKSKLSLSLKPNHRKRNRSVRISSPPLFPSSSSLSSPLLLSPSVPPILAQARLNSHPLAAKCRKNAIEHPPQLHLQRISIKSRQVDEAGKIRGDHCEQTRTRKSVNFSEKDSQKGKKRKIVVKNSDEKEKVNFTPDVELAVTEKLMERGEEQPVETVCEPGIQEKTVEGSGSFESKEGEEKDRTPELANSRKRKLRWRGTRKSVEISGDSGSQERFESRESEGFQSREREGFQSREREGFQSREREGFQSREREGFQSREREGFQSREREGFQSREREGFESREREGFESREREGFESREREGFESREREGFESREREKEDRTPELADLMKRPQGRRRRRASTDTSSESGSQGNGKRRETLGESGPNQAKKAKPERVSKRRRLGLVRSRVNLRSQTANSQTQEQLRQNEVESTPHSTELVVFSSSIEGRVDTQFTGVCCRDESHHSDSFLDIIPDPERDLSPENENETPMIDASLSEASSQGFESDFNLMMTESESGEEEAVLPIRRGVELLDGYHGDVSDCHGDVSNHGNRVRRDECTLTLSPPVSATSGVRMEETVQSKPSLPPGVEICPPTLRTICPLSNPPSVSQLTATASLYGLSTTMCCNPTPFYSRLADTHPAREVNGKLVKIPSKMVSELPEAEPLVLEEGNDGVKHSATPLAATGLHHWKTVLSMLSDASELTEAVPPTPPHPPREPKTTSAALHTTYDHQNHENVNSTKKKLILTPLHPPPHPLEVKKWMNDKIAATKTKTEGKSRKSVENETLLDGGTHSEGNQPINVTLTPVSLKKDTSQLEGPTPQNTCGFKISQSALAMSSHTHEYLTVMSVELHIRTRGGLRPDPEWDPVLTLFYYIHHDYPQSNFDGQSGKFLTNALQGVIAIDIENCGFQAVHVTRGTKKNASPRKQSNVSPNKRPLVKTNSPIRMPDMKMKTASNQIAADPGGQSSQTPSVARGYLRGCVSGEGVEVTYVSSELELLEQLVSVVRRHDPDILLGYDVTMMSWGYLIDRAAVLNLNLTNQLSRTPHQPEQKVNVVNRADSGSRTRRKSLSGVTIPGRIVISVWRLLRKELALTSYSFESTFFQVMHQRIPMFQFQTLTQWYENGTLARRAEVVDYYTLRCRGNYEMLEKLNVIGRTSEFARLYGIEFENVLTRGSQYRVESMLLRLAKPANYIAVSPSIQQRARMAAPECLPLILEPESKFYSDPVLVLDFQSLYPSIVIGYNYCYTTCLGRLRNLALQGHFTFGTNPLNVPSHVLKKVKSNVTVSPNGVVFVDPTIRRGLMPRMLEEILGTRIMVKGSMKKHAADKALNRMLDARQMGLKLIANVTYGYTAASFSGRMPCVEVADSIVGKARETLERVIKLISTTKQWGARVVYGDTDSVFVLLKGASKDEAFRIGREICDRVTADNPKPVKLKFEKVYYPCILQTKKRYCGYMYESPDQTEPVYDAKGIETVRRDTCPAVAKVLQKSLSLLFSTFDLSQVKSYVQRQMTKLLDGHVSIQDHILAKEYRGHYRPGACVPALELARRGVATDPRAEPRPGERVPYVVVYGHPGQPLIQLVRPPLEVAKDPTLRLNGVYYITKQVLPALNRALSLLGVDVYQWYRELPRVIRAPLPAPQETADRKLKGTLGQYFATVHCQICNELTNKGVCYRCRGNPQLVSTMLSQQIHDIESAHHSVTMLCHSCTRTSDPSIPNKCVSLDCPVFYRRLHTLHTLPTVTHHTRLLNCTLSQFP